MKYNVLLFGLLLLIANLVHAQTPSSETFLKKLQDAKAVFVPPASAEPVSVVKNKLAHYDYAFKVEGKNVEVRYIVWPYTEETYAIYNNRQKKEGDTVLNPDKLHRIFAPALFNRIGGDTLNSRKLKLQNLSNESVKKDFGADLTAMCMGPVATDFAKDYKFGFFMLFHKDHGGDIYVLYLFADADALFKEQEQILKDESIFKAVRFNQ